MASDLDKIAQREAEIAKSIEALQKEADELAVARKVISRITLQKIVKGMTQTPQAPRPSTAPTTWEMTVNVLAEAEKAGKDGLTGKELVDGIRNKYWPGLKSGQILPTIYGFLKNERLLKAGGKFKRLKRLTK